MKATPAVGTKTTPISLRQKVYELIKHEIISYKLPPGEPVSESEFAERFQVSKTPIREALTSLQQDNLLEYKPNRGFMVTNISVKDIQEIFEARLFFETVLLRLAIKNITEEEIRELTELNEVPCDRSDLQSVERYIQANNDFHMEIARALHNSRLTRHYQSLLDEAQRLVYMDLETNNVLETWHRSHQRLIDALCNRDEAAGVQAVADIMTNGKKRILGV